MARSNTPSDKKKSASSANMVSAESQISAMKAHKKSPVRTYKAPENIFSRAMKIVAGAAASIIPSGHAVKK